MYVFYVTGRITNKKTGDTQILVSLISASESYTVIIKKLFSWIEEKEYNIVQWYPEGDFCVISADDGEFEIYGTANIESVEMI